MNPAFVVAVKNIKGVVEDKMLVPGFLASSIASGIKANHELDLSLIYSEVPANVAAVFTTNRIKAASILLSKRRIKNGWCQAVLINSGNANACTGKKGLEDAQRLTKLVSKELRISERLVLISSTGIIGRPLPLKRIEKSLPRLIQSLSPSGLPSTARAIMTTDTFPKMEIKRERIGGREITVLGIVKGAGMIMPRLATMLSFILTDLRISPPLLKEILREGVEESFHQITVDGQQSTNDMVLVLANGRAQNETLLPRSVEKFKALLFDLLGKLAKMIVKDGEGATKLVEIRIKGARSLKEAKKVAFSVANSNLVKTAFFGEEVNWGRIMAAVGSSGAKVLSDHIDIFFDEIMVVKGGIGKGEEERARVILKKPEFLVLINLNQGSYQTKVFTSDLSLGYVEVNSSYLS